MSGYIKALILIVMSILIFRFIVGQPADPIIDPVIFYAITSMVYTTYRVIRGILVRTSGVLR